ncbi:hypothetical protein [Actinacidiphila rubida]|uniref:hypothetical protein n=1 Tax=Actinacidiphila rubida TaxID=310780 RepID=UPI001C401903|nr:hypothetical protein [Actinacidiphila rubida]
MVPQQRPADLQAAYGLPAVSTSDRTIAIIDAGVYPTLEKDLTVYRRTFGLPACTTASGCLTLEDYTGGRQPAPQKGAQGAWVEEQVAAETALDRARTRRDRGRERAEAAEQRLRKAHEDLDRADRALEEAEERHRAAADEHSRAERAARDAAREVQHLDGRRGR